VPDGRAGRDGRLTLRIAIVGYGAIAEVHAAALKVAGARLVTVTGPDRAAAERFATDNGVEAVDASLDELLGRDDVEAVVVASPNAVHAEQAAAALEAGRHVLVEIPLAMSLADGERLVAMAASRRVVLGVCHTLRFWEPYRALASILATARPRIRHVIGRRLLERREDTGWTGRARSWADDLLWHHGGHLIDVVLAAFGDDPVVDVTAVAADPTVPGSRPTEYGIGLRTATGAIGTIALSYGSRFAIADLLILANDGSWLISGAQLRSPDGPHVGGTVEAAQADAVLAQDAAFLAACRGEAPFAASGALILPTLRVQQEVADLVDH
jgi:2-hydroxy-4-carboxymuconate semialdehyde hemiacetal dehydrogenase